MDVVLEVVLPRFEPTELVEDLVNARDEVALEERMPQGARAPGFL